MRKEKIMRHAKTTLIVLLSSLLVVYLAYHAVLALYTPVHTQTAKNMTKVNEVELDGILFYESIPITSIYDASILYKVEDKTRVTEDTLLAVTYPNDKETTLNKIKEAEEKLSILREAGSEHYQNLSKQELKDLLFEAQLAIEKAKNAENFALLESLQTTFLTLSFAYELKTNYTVSFLPEIEKCQAEIALAEAELTGQRHELLATQSGLFLAFADDYLSLCQETAIEKLTPSAYRLLQTELKAENTEITKNTKETLNVASLFIGNAWYFAASIAPEQTASYTVGESYDINVQGIKLTGELVRASSDSYETILVFAFDTMPKALVLARELRMTFHWEGETGLRVPIEAIHSIEGIEGESFVYVLHGGKASLRHIEILDSDNGIAIVEGTPFLFEQKKYPALAEHDKIITLPQHPYDGQIFT